MWALIAPLLVARQTAAQEKPTPPPLVPAEARESGAPERKPLPEALLTESTTDIDAEEAGELEFEANVDRAAARVGGSHATLASLEVEWRILEPLGLRVEPSFARSDGGGVGAARSAFGFSGSIAWGLWHDFARGLHLQAELLGHTAENTSVEVFEPGETELPFAADLLGAVRRDRWTLRATVGVEAGGAPAHLPLHADAALLADIVPQGRFGFVGLEVRSDWARQAPLVLAPEVESDMTPLHWPFRLGVALPINVGATGTRASYGLFLRLLWVVTRD